MQLAYVYTEHGEALEADLLRLWNQDINTISLRRMRNLYFRLPAECETFYDIEEITKEARQWNVDTYMLANLFDVMNAVDYHIIASNSKNPPKPPKPIQRPKLKVEKKSPKLWPGKTIVEKGVSS